jgi:hypothetical protein
LGFAAACRNPSAPDQAQRAESSSRGARTASEATEAGGAHALVTVTRVRVGADGRWQVLGVQQMTRAEQLAQNAEKEAWQRRVERGEPLVRAQGSTTSAACFSEDLWVNDEPNQMGNRICVTHDSEAELIGCPEEPGPVFQTRSFWGGEFYFRLWGKYWTADCSYLRTYTLHFGNPWDRRDSFGPPYPSYARVF